jgi:hypothetical protein
MKRSRTADMTRLETGGNAGATAMTPDAEPKRPGVRIVFAGSANLPTGPRGDGKRGEDGVGAVRRRQTELLV